MRRVQPSNNCGSNTGQKNVPAHNSEPQVHAGSHNTLGLDLFRVFYLQTDKTRFNYMFNCNYLARVSVWCFIISEK